MYFEKENVFTKDFLFSINQHQTKQRLFVKKHNCTLTIISHGLT